MQVKQDIAAGLIFAAFGVAGLALGTEYAFGAARSMGPGYLPTLLCWGLIGFGAVIAGKGVIESGELVGRWRLRPLLFVLAAVAIFALSIERFGLVIAVAATALLSAFASADIRLRETLVLAFVLATGSAALFVYGLSLPISVFPP